MAARILLEDEEKNVIEVTISKNSNFLEFEERLQGVLSEAGRQVTEPALADFDADGSALLVGGTKFTAKRKSVNGVMQHFSTYTPDRRILPHATDPARRV